MPVRSIRTVQNGRTVSVKAPNLRDTWRYQESLAYTPLGLRFRTDEERVLGSYAERSVAVYSCVDARASNLQSVPLRFWKKDAGGIKRPIESGPLYDAWQKVNPFWSGMRFLAAIEHSLCYYGNAYFHVEKRGRGETPNLWWIHPGKIKPVRGANYIDGYLFRDFETGTEIPFRPDEIVHIPYFFVENEWEGLSPITAARNGIEAAIDAWVANRKFFRNGMHIAGIVSPKEEGERFTKQQVKDLERDLRERFNGADQAHRLAVLSGAVDIKPWGVAPKDAEFMGLSKWSLADVCRVYRVPMAIVQGDIDGTAYKERATEMRALWTNCLVPEGKFIASELTEKFLPLFPGEADYAEFDFSGIRELQEDQTEIVLQMKVLAESMRVPPNVLLGKYMPDLIPEGTNGFPWGDEPLPIPGLTGLGNANGQMDALADPDQRGQTVRTMLASFRAASVPLESAWRDTPRGKAYLEALQAPQATPEDKSIVGLLERATALIVEAKAQDSLPAYDSDEHRAIMAAFEEQIAPLEQQAQREIASLLTEQSADIVERFGKQSLPQGKAAPEDEESAKEEAMLLALLLLLAMYPADEWSDWTARVDARLRAVLDTAYRGGVAAAYRELGQTPPANLPSGDWMQTRAQASARLVNETTWNQVRQAIADGIRAGETIVEISQRVSAVMGVRTSTGSAVIAATEVITAWNEGALQAYAMSGVVSKVGWLTRLDAKVRDAHRRLHGQKAEPGAYFTVPSGTYKGYRARGPGQFGIAALDVGCRCRLSVAERTDAEGRAFVPATKAPDEERTDFPKEGDTLKVSLRNSQWSVFPTAYAEDIKDNWPKIWDAGGNIRGNEQYAKLLPIAKRGGAPDTDAEEDAIRLREAWGARHYEDFRLAGVVAQIKWLVVGSKGLDHMKGVIEAEKKRLEEQE